MASDAERVLRLLEQHGAALESAKGPLPALTEFLAGEPIKGSWWGHPAGKRIYAALEEAGDSPDVIVLPLVQGKRTWVHRRLWPALVRLADEIGNQRLEAVASEHTPSGAHRSVRTPFPQWVPEAVRDEGARLSIEDARRLLAHLPLRRS